MKDRSLKSETELFEQLMSNGLYLVPGQAFENKENGWFRMIISNEHQLLQTALRRLSNIVRKLNMNEDLGQRRGPSETVVALETSVRKLRNKRRHEENKIDIY